MLLGTLGPSKGLGRVGASTPGGGSTPGAGVRAWSPGDSRRTPGSDSSADPLESGPPAPGVRLGVPRVGRWSPGRSALESGRASSELRVLALWSSVFSIPDSSDFALESSGSSLESGLESRDFGPESGDPSAGVR